MMMAMAFASQLRKWLDFRTILSTSNNMWLLIMVVCCIGTSSADSQAEATEVATNKITSTKSSLNSIPSSIQKETYIQPQYIPQYVVQKPAVQQPAMYIIAQPSGAVHNSMFQQAVQQLLHYYHNNPQARLQLLQQQGGIQPQVYQQPQQTHMPSGALHVIPSPQLESAASAPAAPVLSHQPHGQFSTTPTFSQHFADSNQAVYAVPVQNHQFALSPNFLTQLAPVQSIPVQHQPYFTQSFPQQYSFPSQYHFQPQAQPQIQAQSQPQSQLNTNINFALKQSSQTPTFSANDFTTQNDKSQSSSSNYSPVYRALIKG